MSGRGSSFAVSAAALSFVLLATRVAAACPACAGREDGGVGLFAVYAAMVSLPFLAAALVYRIVKSISLEDSPRNTASVMPATRRRGSGEVVSLLDAHHPTSDAR